MLNFLLLEPEVSFTVNEAIEADQTQNENPDEQLNPDEQPLPETVEEDLRSQSVIEAEEKEAARFQSKKKKNAGKPDLEADFFYDYESVLSKPVISEQSNLPENLVQLL